MLFPSYSVLAKDTKESLTITIEPKVIAKNQWAVLTINQIFKNDSQAIELKQESLEMRALFSKKFEIVDKIDKLGVWKQRIQVYLIKPQRSARLILTQSDFKNMNNPPDTELIISYEGAP